MPRRYLLDFEKPLVELEKQIEQIRELARDSEVDNVIEAIRGVANTGKVGDGKIFVYSLDDAVRIRTGEQGEEAL